MLYRTLSRRKFISISAMSAAALAIDWRKMEALAAKMGPKKNYSTVVIGAGLGGLCCAAHLSQQGIPVTVLEKHNIPGGYATVFDRAGGKFRFEVSLEGTAIKGGHAGQMLKRLGIMDKIRWAALPDVYRVKAGDQEILFPQRDPQAFITELSRHFPEESSGIQGFIQEILGIQDETQAYGEEPKFLKTILKPIFPLRYPKMWRVRNQTLAELMDSYIKDPALRNVLAAMWPYYGLPPSKLSGFYYAVATAGYLKYGSYYIQDRSQVLSDLLADTIEDAGGQVLCEIEAKEILVDQGAVKGVRTSPGKTLPARIVVSNASAVHTLRHMLPAHAVPEDYQKKLSSYRPSISCFIVWLGLNRDIRGTVPWYSTKVHSGQDPEADYLSCMRGEVETCSFGVTLYDTLYTGYSSPGTSTLKLICLSGYEPWRPFEADYRAGNKAAYYKQKDQWTETLILRTEQHLMPGLSRMIEVKVAGTPLTCWRYTGNTDGAIYGFEQSMDNAFMNRIQNRTPIKGLYLASAWGNPGGGFGGALRAGEQTFQQIMEDWS